MTQATPANVPDPGLRLLVAGRGGLLDGVRKTLTPGGAIAVGRSRSCDISLRRTRSFLGSKDPLTLLRSKAFRKISRIHFELAYLPDGRVEIRDFSRNGTFVDGSRVMGTCILEPTDEVVTLQMGDGRFGKLLLAKEA